MDSSNEVLIMEFSCEHVNTEIDISTLLLSKLCLLFYNYWCTLWSNNKWRKNLAQWLPEFAIPTDNLTSQPSSDPNRAEYIFGIDQGRKPFDRCRNPKTTSDESSDDHPCRYLPKLSRLPTKCTNRFFGILNMIGNASINKILTNKLKNVKTPLGAELFMVYAISPFNWWKYFYTQLRALHTVGT